MRRISRCLEAVLVVSSMWGTIHAATPEPVRIADRWELFVDRDLIEQTEGAVELRLHEPVPQEVVLVHDQPWEGNSCGYHTIFQDGPIYRMYYRGWNHNMRTEKQTHPAVVCYAESRDGRTFHRWAEAFIRPGLNADKWHNRSNYIWWGLVRTQSPLPGGGKELSLYTNEGYYFEGKAARTRRYTGRIDGFVSLHASMARGEVLTKPLLFTGNTLVVNFSTSAAGSLQVQIEDLEGRPLTGFAFSDCPEIYGDAIEHTVKWQRGSDVSTLAGKPIRLRLALRDADLYAFGFRDHLQ